MIDISDSYRVRIKEPRMLHLEPRALEERIKTAMSTYKLARVIIKMDLAPAVNTR